MPRVSSSSSSSSSSFLGTSPITTGRRPAAWMAPPPTRRPRRPRTRSARRHAIRWLAPIVVLYVCVASWLPAAHAAVASPDPDAPAVYHTIALSRRTDSDATFDALADELHQDAEIDPTHGRRRLRRRHMATAPLALTSTTIFSYLGKLAVGTPAQTISDVLFDTGSWLAWVAGGQGSAIFDTTRSSSLRPSNIAFPTQSYVDGTVVSGTFANDTVSIAGTPISANAAIFGVATGLSGSLANATAGIVGMGFTPPAALLANASPNAGNTAPTLLDSFIAKGALSSRYFAFWTDETDAGGALDLGALDTAKYSGPIEWLPVSKLGGYAVYWQVVMNALRIADASDSRTTVNANAVLDTGTSLTIIPAALAEKINTALGFDLVSNADGQYMYAQYCNELPASKPTLTITLAAVDFAIPQSVYAWESKTTKTSSGRAICFSAIVGKELSNESASGNAGSSRASAASARATGAAATGTTTAARAGAVTTASSAGNRATAVRSSTTPAAPTVARSNVSLGGARLVNVPLAYEPTYANTTAAEPPSSGLFGIKVSGMTSAASGVPVARITTLDAAPTIIVGMAILRYFYLAYDYNTASPRIGLAVADRRVDAGGRLVDGAQAGTGTGRAPDATSRATARRGPGSAALAYTATTLLCGIGWWLGVL
ncbi:hypothetical protein CXG81DRAFT_24823 [Caulochytrium protostelioides]|uniref:Peptidase A1 domain-containing protein n=1 Tax=Caulochytrium protostelioides TaxID=1555241 RepID=A0A4P9XB00_9FUNG|nr:hypothetical protein CXG81DRAFT_24823 [Caulochytrium protostelioides]|eukprot:RKP02536.1 hypothetical protein CXG81DRAFT_24823 [Caulochytrium protostelioides]